MLFHSNKGISTCDIIKVDIICTCRNRNVAAATRSDKITNSSSNSPLRNVIRHSLVSSLPKIRLKAQSTRGSINLAIFLCFIRSWTQYCYSLAKKMQTSAKKACFQFAECSFSSAKIRFFLVTSKVFGKNVGMMIMKMRVSTLSHLQK